ncbi:MAG: PAS domain S-box protein [Gammaproteobacteria bacterium]|nr:MAG: PAS domain S-box protein [Gammaproteobacteria bacterium]
MLNTEIDATETAHNQVDATEIDRISREERLGLLVNSLVDHAVIVFDISGKIVEWQGAATRITGFESAEAVGQKLGLIFTEEDQAAGVPAKELATAIRIGKAEDKRWHKRKDGSRFYANGTMTPLYNQAGKLCGFSKVFQDETERFKEAERRGLLLNLARHILESAEFDETLSKTVFDMIRVHLDADILFNYKIATDGSLDLVAEVGTPEKFKAAAQNLSSGQAFCGMVAVSKEPVAANKERIFSDAAGTFVRDMGVTSYVCHPLFGRDGKVLGTFSVGSTYRDEFLPSEVEFLQTVSHFLAIAWDRQQAEQKLVLVSAESERRKRLYETILSNTPDLAYVWNLEHRFTYANEILLKMWGKNWDDAIGKNCLELGYEPWHAEMHDREIEEVKKTKRPVRGEVPFAGTFDRRIYDYILVPVLGPDGEVEAVAGTTRDITAIRESQDEAAKLLESEKHHARLIEKVAEASKTLNTLLSAKSIAQLVTEEARTIIGAHQAVVSLTRTNDWSQSINAVSLSDKYAEYRNFDAQTDGSGIYAKVCESNKVMRLTQAELEAHPNWKAFSSSAEKHPPMRGWLAVPLIGHGDKNLGLLQLSDKYEGEFTQDDEAILIQLAAVAAAGIENATAYEKLHDQDRRKDEFLATLAHELRNPLAPIRSGVAVLSRSQLPDSNIKTLAMMERQVSHMVHLIDDLLDVSRISSGKVQLKKEQVPLDQIISAALEVSRPVVEASQHELFISGSGKIFCWM